MTYIFSIRDTMDACRYAVFSDEGGWLYEGYPTNEGTVLPAETQ
jgi:hypothetical protein